MREIKFRAWESGEKVMHRPFGVFMIPKWTEPLTSDNGVKVMQFTGLKDKNGKEIYEGDVVRMHGLLWKAVFDNGCFFAERLDQPMQNRFAEDAEVFGNIYENPELLK